MIQNNCGRFYRHTFKRSVTINAIYTVFYNKMINDYASQGEKHDFYELIYVNTGEIRVTIDNASFRLLKGEYYLHPPNEFHRHSVDKNKQGSVCIITFSSKSLIVKKLSSQVILLNKSQIEKLAEIMNYGSQIFESIVEREDAFYFVKYKDYPIELEQLFLNTLENLLLDIYLLNSAPAVVERLCVNIKDSDKVIDLIKIYLLDHVTSKICISEMCKHFSYGKTSISQKFKNCTGKTIMEYFNELKIEEAAYLIENTELTITEIAYRLNFSNASYFSAVFKQYMGMYPRSYKKSLLKEKNLKFISREN